MVDTVYAAVRMPSSPFIQVDKFAAINDGDIYIGQPDTDPTVPANQVQVYWENEDLTLTPIPQPIKINASGYPVYQGTVGRFVTQTGCSMAVYNRQNVLQYYFDNLLEYDAAQMWQVIQSPTGWEYVGTTEGTLKTRLQGFVTPWDFTSRTEYTTTSAAIQAMFDYAKANKKIVYAYGWTGTLESTVTADGITIQGGTWQGTADWRITNTLLEGAIINKLRIMVWGGNNRIRDCLIDGEVTQSKAGSIVAQASPTTNDSFELSDTEFRNTLFGFLMQGSGDIQRGVFRNLSFYNVGGDCLEFNVVNANFDYGCVIDGIYMENVNGQTPIANSNWGIGIGIAGAGPYGWTIPDSQYAKNFAIRNVYAHRVRQILHLEVTRDSTIENIHGDPDQNVSNGTGLTMSTVIAYGCKRITIDGVYGEPVVTTADPHDVRIVMLEWGVTAGAPSNPCFDMVVRNVSTQNGRVYAGVAANADSQGIMVTPNTYTLENIKCYKLSLFGVASMLNMSNITGTVFDCVGNDSAGGTTSNGRFIRGKSVLRMFNVQFYDANGFADQGWSQCSYTNITSIGSNVYADMRQYNGIDGSIGAKMGNVNQIYTNPTPTEMNYVNFDSNAFPTGREFQRGDLIQRADGKFFRVTVSGAYIPATDNFKIKATTVGNTYVDCNVDYTGNQSSLPWLYGNPLTPGTRITIPGAGAGGADLQTWITRGPYNTSQGVPSSPVRINIAHAIATATAAGTQLAATKPITFVTPT